MAPWWTQNRTATHLKKSRETSRSSSIIMAYFESYREINHFAHSIQSFIVVRLEAHWVEVKDAREAGLVVL